MSIPKYVKYVGGKRNYGITDSGIKVGDKVKVLSEGVPTSTNIYVETPKHSVYWKGNSAKHPKNLIGKNFIYLCKDEYELIEEEKKVENNKNFKFKVGDIVCGNNKSQYIITNSNMTEGKVVRIANNNSMRVRVLKHKNNQTIGTTFTVNPKYFNLVSSPSSNYTITTDMATYVEVTNGEFTAKSRCNIHEDKFDIHVGIDIAMERLEEMKNPKIELPEYVRYIGDYPESGSLRNGDICKVLSGVIKGKTAYDETLYVSCPMESLYSTVDASNPQALKGKFFTYLWPNKYEKVTIHE